MAVVMKAVYDSFGRIVGVETMESGDEMEVTDSDGDSIAIDVSEALDIETFDLTATEEIEISSTDVSVASEDAGKGTLVGHPVHLDVKAIGSDVTVDFEASEQNWDGGEW